MAKSFILRPNADVKVGHKITPSDSLYAYQLINESVPDGMATAITAAGDEIVVEENYTSMFKLNGNFPTIGKIDNVVVGLVAFMSLKGANIDDYHYIDLIVNGMSYGEKMVCSHTTTEQILHTVQYPEIVGVVNEYLKKHNEFPEISVSIRSSMMGRNLSGNKSDTRLAYITQMYSEFYYSDNKEIYQKNDGKYKYASGTYQKKNGTWAEIPSDEAKTIVKNNTIRRG